jgi:AraC family transcriptional regulator
VQIGYVYIRPVGAIYVRRHGPYKSSAAAAWEAMFAWLGQYGLRDRIARGYGVINDAPGNTPPDQRRYDACVEAVEGLDVELAPGMGWRTIPGGAYVVHRHVGRHSTIGAGFSYMHRKWVPGRGLRMDPRRPYLEVYLNDPAKTAARELTTDLCVPVFPVSEVIDDWRASA